jgi:type IV secretory pathway TraG/TraD family ATPase VirD4
MTTRLATAEWADPSLVQQNYAYRDGTIWLGRSASEHPVPVGYTDDRHVCLVSGSRGGKGTTSIVNNLILWPGSICVVDPKGENATITASRRGNGSPRCEGLGQSVQVLDPFNSAQIDDSLRGRFNPLDALDPANDETIDEAGRIADAVVVIHEGNDPFWDESARSMVKGLILHVLTAPEYEGRRNLITVRKLILRGDWEAVEALQNAGETDIPPAHGLLWTGLSNNPAFGGLVAGIGDSFTNMLLNSPKQYESVLQVANRNTEFIDSPAMQRCVEASDFQISELKTRPGGLSVYLCLPQRYMSTHYRWLRMMIALIVTEMEKVRGRPATGYPVLMVMDEFAGLKRMEVIENAVAQIAGYGVKLFFVLQSLEQLKAVYKDNWETFLANSGLKVFFNLEDHFSREYVSKLIGETEVIREVRSASDSVSESESVSRSNSRSKSTGVSESEGTNRSVSTGKSWGVNSSKSKSWGATWGTNWTPGGFWGRRLSGGSDGKSRTQSESHGTSRGWTEGESHGTSESTSRSRTEGTSETESTTYGTSKSRTSGMSETVHKRALVTPDEIGHLFARIDDRGRAAYPGLALVVISGARPIALRRVNYYEDFQFFNLFEPHPDHPYIGPKELTVDASGMGVSLANFGLRLGAWTIKAGELVAAGDDAAIIATSEGNEATHIRVPRSGMIETVDRERDGDSPDGTLFSLLYFEDGADLIDPFEDLRAFCDGIKRSIAANRRRVESKRNSARLALGVCALLASLLLLAMAARGSAPARMLIAFAGFGGLAISAGVRVRRARKELIKYGKLEQHLLGAGAGNASGSWAAGKHLRLATVLVVLAGISTVASPVFLIENKIAKSGRDAAIQRAAEEATRKAEHDRMMAELAKRHESEPPPAPPIEHNSSDGKKDADTGTVTPAPAPSPRNTAPSDDTFVGPGPGGFIHPHPQVTKTVQVCVPANLVEHDSWNDPAAGGKMDLFKHAASTVVLDLADQNGVDDKTQVRIVDIFDSFDPATTDPHRLVTILELPTATHPCPAGDDVDSATVKSPY